MRPNTTMKSGIVINGKQAAASKVNGHLTLDSVRVHYPPRLDIPG